MRGSGTLRVWALALGLVGGRLVSALFGIYDFEHVLSAPWVGLPHGQWPGFHLDFELEFWSLLPAFLLITLVAMPKSIGIAIATQRVSWRRPRAVDFRAVQGAAAAESASNLFAGLSGAASVMPFPVGPSAIQLSKVASRNVGIYAGLILIILAFVPKTLALIIGLPSSVVAGGLFVMLSTVFMTGMQEVLQDGASQRKTLIVGFSFWAGAGFEAELIFPEFFAEVAGGLFQHGMVAGGLIAILLTLADALSQRSSQFSGRVDAAELPKLNEFLGAFASRCGWNGDKAQRLQAVAEEVLALLQPQTRQSSDEPSRLLLTVRKDGEGAVLEFMAGSGDEDLNLEDRIALLSEQPPEGPGGCGGVHTAAAALGVIGPPPAISQRGSRHRPRRCLTPSASVATPWRLHSFPSQQKPSGGADSANFGALPIAGIPERLQARRRPGRRNAT